MADGQTSHGSDAVEAAYAQFGRELWARLYARCCDPDLAYDAMQESFLRLHSQNGEAAAIRDVRAWLWTCGLNWLRDAQRNGRRAKAEGEALDRLPSLAAEPFETLATNEIHARVRDGLSQLEIEDREVLVLRYAFNWSAERMALALESNAAAINMRLSRARRRLGELLERAGVAHESH
jgi:RNA polymerase sigma factor (sigma-70 family)